MAPGRMGATRAADDEPASTTRASSAPAAMALRVVLIARVYGRAPRAGISIPWFLLADLRNRFRYLKLGLAVILVFVGVKLTVVNLGIKIDPILSLVVVVSILAVAIAASGRRPETTEGMSHPGMPWLTDEPGEPRPGPDVTPKSRPSLGQLTRRADGRAAARTRYAALSSPVPLARESGGPRS